MKIFVYRIQLMPTMRLVSPIRTSLRRSWTDSSISCVSGPPRIQLATWRSSSTTTTTRQFHVGKTQYLHHHRHQRPITGGTQLVVVATTSTRRLWLWQVMSAAAVTAMAGICTHSNYADMEEDELEHEYTAPPLVMTDAVCHDFVSVWQKEDRLIYLMGTVKRSSASAKLAKDLVKDVRPGCVFVQLDLTRILAANSKARFLNPTSTVDWTTKERRAAQKTVPWVCLTERHVFTPESHVLGWEYGFPLPDHKKLTFQSPYVPPFYLHDWSQEGKKTYREPEDAFSNAMREGVMVGSSIVLGDRDRNYTAKRWAIAKRQTPVRSNGDSNVEVEEEEGNNFQASKEWQENSDVVVNKELLEAIRQRTTIMKQTNPVYYHIMMKECDEFMAAGLDVLHQHNSTVAVVGAAHLEGIEGFLQDFGWTPVAKSCPNVGGDSGSDVEERNRQYSG